MALLHNILLAIMKDLNKGDKIAIVKTIFGKTIKEYFCPENGIVIGKSVNPVNQSGSRILHLGINPQTIACITEEEMDS